MTDEKKLKNIDSDSENTATKYITSNERDVEYDDNGNILKSTKDIFNESMLPYSEYVILERALPRVEDGLKPVQRRILYSMYDIGLTPDKPYKKSAKVVGDVIANYHPHGDASAYGAMVRLAQNFNMREPLVDGHGNFGSMDGDPPAAMRYTETKLTPLALEMLKDIEKDTVKWSLNFDDTRYEPDMLPSKFPNLLVNGSEGIAVGLSTKIPTHNLGETIDGCCAYIDNKNITLEEIMEIIKGPDFPTGGIMLDYDGLKSAYETGKGKITIRSKTNIEDGKLGKKDIIITEFPYGVNKSQCLLSISELKEEHKDILSGISDIRDESDKEGVRAVISIKAGFDAEKILNYLFQKTDLEISYAINTVAIANGKPQLLGLLDILKYYTEYQRKIVYNRTKYDLESAQEKAHILEGLIVAIANIDEVVRIIKTSSSPVVAKVNLCTQFNLDEKQAQAILDMRLARLTSLEVEKLENDLAELHKLISKLTKILNSETMQYNIVKKEMQAIKVKFATERKTLIEKEITKSMLDEKKKNAIQEMAPLEDCIVCIGQNGNLKRISKTEYDKTGRVITDKTTMIEIHSKLIKSTTKSNLIVFTNLGNYCTLKTIDLPDSKWRGKGAKLKDLFIGISSTEIPIAVYSYDNKLPEGDFILYCDDGSIKITPKKEFSNKNSVLPAIKMRDEKTTLLNVEDGDALSKKEYIAMVTRNGSIIKAKKTDMTPTKRDGITQKGMNISTDDILIFAKSVNDEDKLTIMTSEGYMKQVNINEFEAVQRGGKGSKITILNEITGNKLLFVDLYDHKKEIYIITEDSKYSVANTLIPEGNKATRGKLLIKGIKEKKIKNVLKYEWDTEDATF